MLDAPGSLSPFFVFLEVRYGFFFLRFRFGYLDLDGIADSLVVQYSIPI
jgi:hypothetical protein